MSESALERMKALVTEINEHCYRYYVLGQPTIADAQFDQLYDELLALEKETGIVLPDSPAHRVGVEPVSAFPSFTHRARLWSMDKAQTMESVMDWIARMQRAKETEHTPLPLEIVLEYKYDGLTVKIGRARV